MGKRIVTQLWVYPVKSLGGIRTPSAKVLPKGLESDRRWMLIDDENMFMTQRAHHKMALFTPSWINGQLKITYNGDSIVVPEGASGAAEKAAIWDDIVTIAEVDKNISTWFSDHLSFSCRLVAFPEGNARPVDPRYKVGDDHVSLADGYPLLVIGQSSLDDLNTRLQTPVPMNRFRPNVVFSGGDAFEEDTWSRFKIGNNSFAAVKRCGRCAMPGVDQATGIMGKEPIATLNKYRKEDGKVLFGMNLIPLDHLEIHEGDEITF